MTMRIKKFGFWSVEFERIREPKGERGSKGDEFNSWPICLFFIVSPWCFLSQSFFPFALQTQSLTHWFTCPTFLCISSSDWLGTLANSQSWGVYTAGWPVKGRARVCVCVCMSVLVEVGQTPIPHHISLLLTLLRPPLLPLFLQAYTSHSPKPLHAFSSSFPNYPSLS